MAFIQSIAQARGTCWDLQVLTTLSCVAGFNTERQTWALEGTSAAKGRGEGVQRWRGSAEVG